MSTGGRRPDVGDDRPPVGFDRVRPSDLPVGVTHGRLAAGFGIIAALILLAVRSRRRSRPGSGSDEHGAT